MADEKPEGEQASTLSEDELLEAKLAAFDDKVKKAGTTRMPEFPDWQFERKQKQITPGTDHRGLGIGMTAAYILVGGMGVGWLIGFAIDHIAHSSPTGQAVGGFLGAGIGLAYVIVLANREGK